MRVVTHVKSTPSFPWQQDDLPAYGVVHRFYDTLSPTVERTAVGFRLSRDVAQFRFAPLLFVTAQHHF